MLFNSLEFGAFFLIAIAAYHGLMARASWTAKKAFLVVASYVFYMSWSPAFGLLLLTSTVLDYLLARKIEVTTHRGWRRIYLLVSLSFNLGMLGFFKYGGFVADNLWPFFGTGDAPLRDMILPVGISFYTFESLSYTIDVYRGEAASKNLLDFSLFLSFFPHLVAGPIVRPRQFLPQLASEPRIREVEVEDALARIAIGFVKKVLLADTLGVYVDAIWQLPGAFSGPNVLLALYAYTFQIYFDFSGYTDIALGLARLWGFELPENFDRPYRAYSPREFWQRWHISLSTWLRDYLYVSLGGNRGGTARTYLNLFLTMLLGGLWHGPAWTFVAWGAFHGLWLVVHRWLTRSGEPARTPGPIRLFVTFHLVVLSWALFRAPTLADAWQQLLALASWKDVYISHQSIQALVILLVAATLHWAPPAGGFRRRFIAAPAWAQGVIYAIGTALVFLQAPASARFIYFQF
jgi:alginate O-acetyltransferase complex protein AlgI